MKRRKKVTKQHASYDPRPICDSHRYHLSLFKLHAVTNATVDAKATYAHCDLLDNQLDVCRLYTMQSVSPTSWPTG
jgi:hypothetical protein